MMFSCCKTTVFYWNAGLEVLTHAAPLLGIVQVVCCDHMPTIAMVGYFYQSHWGNKSPELLMLSLWYQMETFQLLHSSELVQAVLTACSNTFDTCP